MPFVLEDLLGAHVLGIDHQSRGIAVQTVDDVGITLLSRFPEIAVEDGLDVERGVACRHGQDACSLFDYDEILVFIDDLQVAALE